MAYQINQTVSANGNLVEMGNMATKIVTAIPEQLPEALANQLITLSAQLSVEPIIASICQLDPSVLTSHEWQCAMFVMLKELKHCLYKDSVTPCTHPLSASQINFITSFTYQPQLAVLLLLSAKEGLGLDNLIDSVANLNAPSHSITEAELLLYVVEIEPKLNLGSTQAIQKALSTSPDLDAIDWILTVNTRLREYISRKSTPYVEHYTAHSFHLVETPWSRNQQLWHLLSQTTVSTVMNKLNAMVNQAQVSPHHIASLKQVTRTLLSIKGLQGDMAMEQWLKDKEKQPVTVLESGVLTPDSLHSDQVLRWVKCCQQWKQPIVIHAFISQSPQAICQTTIEDIKYWLETEPTPALHRSLLFACCQCGHIEHLKYLINTIPQWQLLKGENGESLLHQVCCHGQPTLIPVLLAAGLYLDTVDDKGHTPLHCAVHFGKLDCIEQLIKAGARYDQQVENSLHTVFHITVLAKQYHVLEWLLSQAKFATALKLFNANGLSAAHLAVKLGDERALTLLCLTPKTSLQLHIQAQTQQGFSLLHIAIIYRQQALIDTLWDKGLRNIESGQKNLLMLATQAGMPNLIHRLMKHNPDFIKSAILENGITPVHIAAKNDDYETLVALLNYDVAINQINQAANTSLELTVNQQTLYLDGQVTPLHLTIVNHSHKALKLLLSFKVMGSYKPAIDCNLSLKDIHQCSPLHLAALTANQFAVQRLLSFGVCITQDLVIRVDKHTVEKYYPWAITERYWPPNISNPIKALFRDHMKKTQHFDSLPYGKESVSIPETKKGSDQTPCARRRRIPRRLT
ncbi:ankyrin repeat domain-containing protein [Parashewanella tropica]|uniref:ankyrin repeat domain-containing protein n=1 Tax=Parashewanella tropica TaxID=2547970 RepID=UPI00105A93E7|nr:ankyrin repeat domain-containing protein [Parashewanella tropica]